MSFPSRRPRAFVARDVLGRTSLVLVIGLVAYGGRGVEVL